MRRLRSLSLILASGFLLLALPMAGRAQQAPAKKASPAMETELRNTMQANIRSAEAENLDSMMRTIHSGAPLFQQTRQQMSQVFGRGLGLKYQLVSLKYLATDGDYALARVRQRTTKTPADSFKNN